VRQSIFGLAGAAALVVFQHSEMAQFLAAMPITKHFIQPLMGSAVSMFFVLSGFILQYNYPALATKTDRYNFLCARVARLWPCHLLFALLFLCFSPNSGGFPLVSPYAERTVLNLLMLQSWIPIQQTYFSLNGVSWSISTEFFFYVAFIFLAGCSPRRFRLTLGFSFLFVLVAAAFCSTAGIPNYSDAQPDQMNYHGIMSIFPVTRLAEFLIGMGMCRFRARILAGPRPAARNFGRDTLVELVAVLLVLLWMSCAGPALEFIGRKVPSPLNTYLGCAHGAPVLALLIMVFSFQRGWLSSILGWRLLVFLGEISYSLYLCHQLVHEWLTSRGWFIHPFVLSQAGYWCLILVISSMSILLVERPLRRLLTGILRIRSSDSGLATSRQSVATSPGL
jgi:peptidoglycan/LPS O-acetylase OafA/YrhL